MPEGLEAEIWRTALDVTVGRIITDAWVDERVAPADFADLVVGQRIEAIRRVGKIDLVDTDGPTIGLHFGMTGRVIVDGFAAIDRLQYASARDEPEWDRLRLYTSADPTTALVTTPAIRLNDPRRLGRVSIDADLSPLGVDMMAVTPARLRAAIGARRVAIKSVLLDQSAVAGLGNMCADEVLWWAGIEPRRSAGELSDDEVRALASAIRRRLPIMLRRGGSHTGVLSPAVRAACPPCERDGAPLRRDVIGGRTAVWCPRHQR
ncbi:MAG: DNA-formamidopyrimidine glycosylase family protein [Ilumatobacteraceae bacterium]